MKSWTPNFCVHAIKGPIIIMNQLKSIYNSPFKNSHSHPIHICLATIASNEHLEILMILIKLIYTNVITDRIRSIGEGNVFTGVCHSVRKGPSIYADPPPCRPPPPLRYLGRPPCDTVNPGIRSICGRYASYWNAFLLFNN